MRRSSARRGFSLAELLCAALALCLLAGAAAFSFRAPDEKRIVLEEADELRSWLSSRMAQAAREGADFKLVANSMLGSNAVDMHIEWYSGTRAFTTEIFKTQRAEIWRDTNAKEHTFDGEWFTLTPAASFIIRSRRDPSVWVLVTVSGTGYVGVKETLEGQ